MASAAPEPPSDPLISEIERSRRYRHALTLIRVAPGRSAPSPAPWLRPGHRRRDPLDELAASLRRCLRSGDVAWSDGSALFVLLPETDTTGARAMLARFRRTTPSAAGEPDVRIASFPEHGLTHHALRAAVARQPRPVSGAGVGNAWPRPYVRADRRAMGPER